MTRAEVCRRIEEIGVVPVIRLSSARLVLHAVEALAAGGVPVVEITLTIPGASSVLREVATRFGGAVLIGAGTVTSPDEARASVQAGAQFIVSPGFGREVVEAAHALDVPVVPGVLTPTEIMAATRAGADWLKIFPCSALGGAKYLRALRGPFPQLKLLPTGGVSLETAADYIAAGAAALGVGSELVVEAELEAGDFSSLRDRAQAYAAAVRAARSKTLSVDPNPSLTRTLSRGV
jgi:2-dehydro-3-deoxyphosphogluconate aldolase/(4S)-4-hydroxy-2-oxoglutarate aldolase